MAASVNDKFRRASSGTRPVVANLASPKANGSNTAILNVATGWNTTTGVDLIMYLVDTAGEQVAGSQTDWVATLSGTTLSNMTLIAGTEPSSGYPQGSSTVVVATPTAAWADALMDGILTHADQDGTLKAGAVDVPGVLAADVVTSTKIAQNAVQADDLATNAITLGYAQITAQFNIASTSPTQVTGLTISVTIPAGGRRIRITAYTSLLFSSTNNARADMTIWDGTVGSGTQISRASGFQAGGAGANSALAVAIVTPSAGSKTYNVALSATAGTATLDAAATAPAFVLVEAI